MTGDEKHSNLDSEANQAKQEFRMLLDFLDEVIADICHAEKALKHHDSSSARRTLIRNTFSAIEAIVSYLAASLVTTPEHIRELSEESIFALKGKRVEIGNSGNLLIKEDRSPFLSRLKFVIRCKFKALKVVTPISKFLNTEGYQALCRSIKVRDRLVHPKTINDLKVTDSQLRDADIAFNWVLYIEYFALFTKRIRYGTAIEMIRESLDHEWNDLENRDELIKASNADRRSVIEDGSVLYMYSKKAGITKEFFTESLEEHMAAAKRGIGKLQKIEPNGFKH